MRTTTDVFDPPAAASAPRVSLPSPKLLLIGGAGLVAIVLAFIVVPKLFVGGGGKLPPPQPSAAVRRPAPQATTTAQEAAGAVAIKPSSPEGAATIAAGIKQGRERMAAGDFGGAVVGFSRALSLDPQNAEAKAGFEEARDRYKSSKTERDALNTIKLAYRDGEFTSGLRLAYRLPPTVSKADSDAIKLAGWHNLAIVALRAGDCKGAITQLDEALQIDPEDAEVKAVKDLATKYVEAVKDREFFDKVEALAFRTPPKL
jgi:Flp pilus assembly protein TadD